MREYCIYCYTNIINNKKYVGQSRQTLEERAGKEGLHYTIKRGAFGNAIKKYGWSNFVAEILEDGLTLEEANEREQYWIRELNTLAPNGYNLASGGSNYEWHDVSKKKLSQAKMGHEVTQETREKLRQAFIGKPLSEETKQKISENSATAKKIWQYSLDGHFIAEWPSMMEIERQLGVNAHWIRKCCQNPGKHHGGGFLWFFATEGQPQDIVYKPRVPVHTGSRVCQYTKDGQFIAEYSTINEASKQTGATRSGIKNVCEHKPRYNTAGGFIWRYKEVE